MTTKLTLLALLLSLTGCAHVRAYQAHATAKCGEHHTAEQCKPLSYPACNENGCHQ